MWSHVWAQSSESAPALSLYYRQSSGCAVCCGSVATGNKSMITPERPGCPQTQVRTASLREDNAELQLPSVILGLCTYQ